DRNRSHWSTSKTPSYTKSVSWQHHRRVNGNATMTPTFGTLASPQTYGHTGWTGTVTVIDPVNHMTIVMLSNKPHSPVADPQKNPNMFESGQLPIATYGWVVDQVYAALKQK
ncbi:serine hydrolase, partial [Escherichia coli]|nr:serine hydrolase [Escherichia coli]